MSRSPHDPLAIPADGAFDTGMRYTEAMARAEKWWNEWRGVIPREFNHDRTVTTRTGVNVPLLRSVRNEMTLDDGILSGKAWADLTEEERQKIAVIWHHFQVRVPLESAIIPKPDTAIIGPTGGSA